MIDPFGNEHGPRPPGDRRDQHSTVTWVDRQGFHVAHVPHGAPDLAAAMVKEVFTSSIGAGFSMEAA